MPLATYPEALPDAAIVAAAGFAASLACTLHVTTFAVDVPRVASPLGNLLVDIPGLVHATEERSRAECLRLHGVVQRGADHAAAVACTSRRAALGTVPEAAAVEARHFDLVLLPSPSGSLSAQDMPEGLAFGSGRPTVLVPQSTPATRLDHIAIVWDGRRVATRALNDALPLLAADGRLSILTVEDEKPPVEAEPAETLARCLKRRGFDATPLSLRLGSRTIADALQETAMAAGARLLAMGGFGHSRLRDFILGGATKGVLGNVRLPVLISH